MTTRELIVATLSEDEIRAAARYLQINERIFTPEPVDGIVMYIEDELACDDPMTVEEMLEQFKSDN